jgi:hypothetical protein
LRRMPISPYDTLRSQPSRTYSVSTAQHILAQTASCHLSGRRYGVTSVICFYFIFPLFTFYDWNGLAWVSGDCWLHGANYLCFSCCCTQRKDRRLIGIARPSSYPFTNQPDTILHILSLLVSSRLLYLVGVMAPWHMHIFHSISGRRRALCHLLSV